MIVVNITAHIATYVAQIMKCLAVMVSWFFGSAPESLGRVCGVTWPSDLAVGLGLQVSLIIPRTVSWIQ